ncbi:MAG TPA: hypothetical protein VFR81_14830 [Longimicrobium sp.]|nr:hypothetical protein [Longimicrobium sp.]
MMDEPGDVPIYQLPGGIEGGEPIDGDGGGGGGGGGGTVPPPDPFAPPPPPLFVWDPMPSATPMFNPSGVYSCGQVTHPFWGLGNGTWSNDITRGTTLYVSGIVVPGTQMGWGIYNTSGYLVKGHGTQPARSNCVVHHESEALSTWDLEPGYYHVFAAYYGVTNGGVESSSGTAQHYSRYVGPLRIR